MSTLPRKCAPSARDARRDDVAVDRPMTPKLTPRFSPFEDVQAIEHARRFASTYYGPEFADEFVGFLQSLTRVSDLGYRVCLDDFETRAGRNCPECERSHGPHYTGPCTH
jgi:hypothetical protein